MRIGPYRFRPRPLPTLAFLVLFPLLAGLGIWQLDRATEKQNWLEDLRHGANAAPLDLNARLPAPTTARFRRAVASGRFDAAHQFLLDNQVRQARVGYRVFTPLHLDGGGTVLVERGWVPAPTERSRLPSIPVDAGRHSVRGVLYDGPATGIRLGPAYQGDGGWPRRIQYLDFQALSRALGRTVSPPVLRALDETALRDDPKAPEPEFGPWRHRGYAVQWFGLAAALAVIFIVVNTRRTDRGTR